MIQDPHLDNRTLVEECIRGDRDALNLLYTRFEPKMLGVIRRYVSSPEDAEDILHDGFMLSGSRLESLRRAGLHNITISLDGPEAEHNWMRNNPASFRRALEAIRMVASSASDLNFDVVTCVNRRSLPRLGKLKEMLVSAGVKRWRLFTIFPAGQAADHPEFELSASETDRLMEFIVSARREGRIQASFCCEGFMAGYDGKVRE